MKNLISFLFIICLIFYAPNSLKAQAGEWTWMHGSNIPGSAGNFGIQGVPDPANEPPSVYEACEWTDLNGNFWIFGGWGNSTRYGCLWKYDVATNEWTWMKGPAGGSNGIFGTQGVSSPANNPRGNSHGGMTWTDQQGNLWMFGGASSSNALWKYSIATNEWTWMKGPNTSGQPGVYGTMGVPDPANTPGVRWEAATAWTDAVGNLWMFGGADNNTNAFNDVWKYDILTNDWTWMKGSSLFNQPAVYGTKGVEDPANDPGGRVVYTRWTDLQGNLWLFGGANSAIPPMIQLNDLWRFNPSTNCWTWMNGSNLGDQPGTYGNRCTGDSLNTPGARFENRAVSTDQNGNFWMFGGGKGISGGGFIDTWNDLWKYCVNENKWIWVSGDYLSNPGGNWGTLGVSDPANVPNGRGGASLSCDQNGNIFMFGGTGFGFAPCNDLWRFKIDTLCGTCSTTVVVPVASFTADNLLCPGTCTDFTNLSTNASTYLWNFPGGNPSVSSDASPSGICYNSPGNYDVTLIASNGITSDTLTMSSYIIVYPSPPPQGILQSGDTLFANQGATSYQWYFNGSIIIGATDYFYVATQSGDYNVVATDENDCEVEAVINNVLAHAQSAEGNLQLAIFPNPVNETLTVTGYQVYGKAAEIFAYNILGEKVMAFHPFGNQEQIVLDVRALSSGLYLLEVNGYDKTFRVKFVKE